MAFVEAIRQLQLQVRPEDFCLVHVSMVPSVGDPPEQKTKPTQHSVKGNDLPLRRVSSHYFKLHSVLCSLRYFGQLMRVLFMFTL